MKIYNIELTGKQPLLMHADDIEWADKMDAWKTDKEAKKNSKAGDDRSPAFRWIGYLYRDEHQQIVIPTDNIMRALMEAGAMVPTGKGQKTFKSQTQSGIMPRVVGWPLLVKGKPISTGPIDELLSEKDFEKHKQRAIDLGFSLFLKRAKIGQSKHVRVRPRFDQWTARGQLVVTDEQITDRVLTEILETAGNYKGLCDWRPGGKTPGSYGMFDSQVSLAR